MDFIFRQTEVESLWLYQNYAPLQKFAKTYSYLSRFLNVLETSAS